MGPSNEIEFEGDGKRTSFQSLPQVLTDLPSPIPMRAPAPLLLLNDSQVDVRNGVICYGDGKGRFQSTRNPRRLPAQWPRLEGIEVA